MGMSRLGTGTVTLPFFVGCLNCLWLPTWLTSYQPSSCNRLITSRLCTIYDTHLIHTCQWSSSRACLVLHSPDLSNLQKKAPAEWVPFYVQILRSKLTSKSQCCSVLRWRRRLLAFPEIGRASCRER